MTIKRRDFLKKAGAGAGVVALGACAGGEGEASGSVGGVSGPRVNWRLTGSFAPSADILYGSGERLAQRVSDMTGGNFTIRVYAAGEIVPPLQVMDGVMQGTVQCGISPGYYYTGKHPALAFDAAVPFGLNSRQQISWLYHGGGLDLLNNIYSDFGLITFPISSTGGQMGGWFREPVNSLADLQGLRMRIPGMGGEIMSRLGATVQVLAGAEIYPALERGAIDATEWVGPHDDEKLGLYQVAKNYYYPGWWEPGVTMSLLTNQAAFDELPPAYQAVLRTACGETISHTLSSYDAANPAALQRLTTEHGVTLHAYANEIMEAAWTASMDFLEEQAAGDAVTNEVYQSWKTFRDMSFPYAAGNEATYASFAFPKIGNVMG
jgi:TRAP-type mannitol/chloroaromatic compound transport system substrate-binding protein